MPIAIALVLPMQAAAGRGVPLAVGRDFIQERLVFTGDVSAIRKRRSFEFDGFGANIGCQRLGSCGAATAAQTDIGNLFC